MERDAREVLQYWSVRPGESESVFNMVDEVAGERCDQFRQHHQGALAIAERIIHARTYERLELSHASRGSPTVNGMRLVRQCMVFPVCRPHDGSGVRGEDWDL